MNELTKVTKLKTGDKVVYPGHGVGEIIDVLEKRIGGTSQQFFSISLVDSGMKILVPVAQRESVGLRRVVDKKTVERVFAILKDRSLKVDTQTWNRRFREYSLKIKTGSVFEIAEVIRDLRVLSGDKELSFGEKKMLDTAEGLLASEIAVARSRSHDKVMGDLQSVFQ
jgi:CarD family transcriptional regulator